MNMQEVQLGPIIPAFKRLKPVDEEFEVSLGCRVRIFLKNKQTLMQCSFSPAVVV